MPTYEYTCSECQAEVDVVHKVDEDPGACLKCGGALERAFRTAPRMQATSEMRKMHWSTEDKRKENNDWIGQRQEENEQYKRTGH